MSDRVVTHRPPGCGGWGALTTAQPGLGLFPAPLLWLCWWCPPQPRGSAGMPLGGGQLNQVRSCGITAPGGQSGAVAPAWTGRPWAE